MTSKKKRSDRQWALDRGYTFKWMPSEDTFESFGWDESIRPEDIDSIDELEMRDAQGNVVQSLGGIGFGPREGEDVRRDFEDQLSGNERREAPIRAHRAARKGRPARSSNPAPGGLVRGVITLGLAALGVTGVVMGIREAKRSW